MDVVSGNTLTVAHVHTHECTVYTHVDSILAIYAIIVKVVEYNTYWPVVINSSGQSVYTCYSWYSAIPVRHSDWTAVVHYTTNSTTTVIPTLPLRGLVTPPTLQQEL